MKIIKILPAKRFGRSWTCSEGDGVEPAFKKQGDAISYAKTRFGGFPHGEIHVYNDKGDSISEVIKIDGGGQYGQPQE